ncbi:MAG: response regulator transcription factor [Thiotrichaceae bacterium]|nr:response regulator transcription factor [Thiotrichaceae bacterium]
MTKSILIVDDDPHIREVICFALEKAGMTVYQAVDGLDAVRQYQQFNIQLIVLDINMPEMDGIECCREVRKTSDVPILFLSSRDDEIDRILGLEIGGDDYVTKPFSPRELVARINAILKRTLVKDRSRETSDKIFNIGKLALNLEQYVAQWKEQKVVLTATEFAILTLFVKQPQRVFNREHIMQHAYQFNVHVSDRTIDSHIRHIRAKFRDKGCDNIIETLHGIGYKLSHCQ